MKAEVVMRRKAKKNRMAYELVLTSGVNESILAQTKSEGLAKQLQRTLNDEFESHILIRPINE